MAVHAYSAVQHTNKLGNEMGSLLPLTAQHMWLSPNSLELTNAIVINGGRKCVDSSANKRNEMHLAAPFPLFVTRLACILTQCKMGA